MKLFAVAALAAVLAIPAVALAQQYPPYPPPPYPQQQYPAPQYPPQQPYPPQQQYPQPQYPQPQYPAAGYPQQPNAPQQYPGSPQASRAAGSRATDQLYNRWSKFLANVNLSSQQHQQIQNLLDQYNQQRSTGRRDYRGSQTLRRQIFAVLTTQQQTQVEQQIRNWKISVLQRQLQRLRQEPLNAEGPAPAATP